MIEPKPKGQTMNESELLARVEALEARVTELEREFAERPAVRVTRHVYAPAGLNGAPLPPVR